MPKPQPDQECPVARSLAELGERWSLLILRDAFTGLTRFDDFRKSLGCPTNMLATRLKALEGHGLLRRCRYRERPPRDDYVLTAKGRDLFPVLAALIGWGNRWLAPEGAALLLADPATGRVVEPRLVDGDSGRPLAVDAVALIAGPAAGPQIRTMLDRDGPMNRPAGREATER